MSKNKNKRKGAKPSQKKGLELGTTGGGFIGFSAFAESSNGNFNTTVEEKTIQTERRSALPPLYDGDDGEINVVCKKLLKKDNTTKLKALKELQTFCTEGTKGNEALTGLIPHWVFLYNRLALENDRRVREQINRTLRLMLQGRKRAFVPYMGSLIGWWHCLTGDPCPEVSTAAVEAFEFAFPPPKRPEVLGTMFFQEIAVLLHQNLSSTPESLSDLTNCTAEEADERFERVVVSSLYALSRLVRLLPLEQNKKLLDENGYGQLVNAKTWKRLTAKRAALRGAGYRLLATCSEKLAIFLHTSGQLERLAAVVASVFGEADMLNISLMWDAVLIFYRTFPEAWDLAKGNRTDFNKVMFPQLWKMIKTNFRGLGAKGFPPLLPFLAMIPANILTAYNKGGKAGLISDLFKALDQVGETQSVSVEDQNAAIAVKIECATYLLVSPVEQTTEEESTGEEDPLLELCLQPIIDTFKMALCWPPQKRFFDPLQKALGPLHRITVNTDAARLISCNSEHLWGIFQEIALEGINTGHVESAVRFSKDLAELMHPVLQSLYQSDLPPDPGGLIGVVLSLAFEAVKDQLLRPEVLPLFSLVAEDMGLVYLLESCYNSVLPKGLIEFYETQMKVWVKHAIENSVTLVPLSNLLKSLLEAAKTEGDELQIVWWKEMIEEVCAAWDIVSLKCLLEIGTNLELKPGVVLAIEDFCEKLAQKVILERGAILDQANLDGLFFVIGQQPFISTECLSSLVSHYLENPENMELLSLLLLIVCGCNDEAFKQVLHDLLPQIWTLIYMKGDENALTSALSCPLEEILTNHFGITNASLLQPFLEQVCSLVVSERETNQSMVTQDHTFIQQRSENLALLIVRSLQMAQYYDLDDQGMANFVNSLGVYDPEQWKMVKYTNPIDHRMLWNTQYEILKVLHDGTTILDNSSHWIDRLSGQSCPSMFWEMMVAYMLFDTESILISLDEVSCCEASSWWCCTQDILVEKSPIWKISGLTDFFLSSVPEADFFARVLKEGVQESRDFLNHFSTISSEVFSEGIALRLELLHLMISHTIGKGPKLQNALSLEPELFQKGDDVIYEGPDGSEEASVLKIHYDDGTTDPYMTVRLASGKEKQTVMGKLKRKSEMLGEGSISQGKQTATDILDMMIEEEQALWVNAFENDDQYQNQENQGRLAILKVLVLPCLHICGTHQIKDAWISAAEKWASTLSSLTSTVDISKVLLSLRVLGAHYEGFAFLASMIPVEDTFVSLQELLRQTKQKTEAAQVILEFIQIVCSMGIANHTLKPFLEKFMMEAALRLNSDPTEWLFVGRALYSVLNAEYLQVLSKDFKAFLLTWGIEKLLLLLKSRSSYGETSLVSMCLRLLHLLAPLDELPSMWTSVRDRKDELISVLLSPSVKTTVKIAIYEILQGEIRNRKVDFREVEQPSDESKAGLLGDLDTYFSKMNITEEVEQAEIRRDFQISCRVLPSQIRLHLEQAKSMKAIKAKSATTEETDEGSMTGDFQKVTHKCTEEKTFLLVAMLTMDYINSIDEGDDIAKGAVSAYISHIKFIPTMVELCFVNMQQKQLAQVSAPDLNQLRVGNIKFFSDSSSMTLLCMKAFYQTLTTFPALVRQWWSHDCRRGLSSRINNFTKEKIGPLIMQREIDYIRKAAQEGRWGDTSEMTVKGSKVSREVTATYLKDECSLEVVIKVPPTYPLCNVEVQCTKRLGITEGRWRRWVMQIVTLLSMQDGTVLDAVLLWKQNVDKEFEGVEPCPICFSILYPKDHSLPSLVCKTCSNKFHSSCLYKWFHTSHKNKCPLCQQPF